MQFAFKKGEKVESMITNYRHRPKTKTNQKTNNNDNENDSVKNNRKKQ